MPTTIDALLDGLVAYEQPATGYRVSLEAPLLARFAVEGLVQRQPARRPARGVEHVVDLGSGPGAVGLCLAKTGWARSLVCVELDAEHAELARRNVSRNELADRVRVVEQGWADFSGLGGLPPSMLVISNPPYFLVESGPSAPHPQKARARSLSITQVNQLAAAARRCLASRGRFVVAFAAPDASTWFEALTEAGLHPKRMRALQARPDRPAHVLFVEAAAANPGGLVLEPALVVRGLRESTDGLEYLPEADAALRGRWPLPGEGSHPRSATLESTAEAVAVDRES